MLNNYYQKHKERLRKEARERCQNLSGKEKENDINIIWNVRRSCLTI